MSNVKDVRFSGWSNVKDVRFSGWSNVKDVRFSGWSNVKDVRFSGWSNVKDVRFSGWSIETIGPSFGFKTYLDVYFKVYELFLDINSTSRNARNLSTFYLFGCKHMYTGAMLDSLIEV